jgi:UDP:flavonoid glycosyltransferase YjiC (YdhE family)
MSSKRIVISTFGSFGDVHPYIAIALELKARGHHPVFATSEVYREKMDSAGIDFHPVRPIVPSYDQPEDLAHFIGRAMDPKTGSEVVADMVVPHVRDIYDDLDAATEGADLLLTHPLPLVGPIIAQKKRLNWISTVLAPASFLSIYDPIVPPQWPSLHLALRLSPWIGRGVMALAKIKMDKILQPVYELRAELGMPRGEQPILNGQHSPTKVLALFSKLLASPQPDWPANTVVTGFPFYDRRDFFGETEIPSGLVDFIESGSPPIVFTLGSSAIWVAHNFYRDSIEAARVLGRRALVLIGHARNMPPLPLPEGVEAFEYAPYSEVLSRACAIVHHGGVGTTGQGMRSGQPVLIVPHALDQFDNAARVARLGCGRGLPRPHYNVESAIRELRKLFENQCYSDAAARVGEVVREEDGASVAATEIENVLNVQQHRFTPLPH